MICKAASTIFFLLTFNLSAQYLERNPFEYFDDIPTSRFNLWGVGSIGFDSRINYYNPNYFTSDSKFGILVFGTLNLHSVREYVDDFNRAYYSELTGENTRVIPNVSLHYKWNNILFNLSYLNTLYFNRRVLNTSGSIRFYVGAGGWTIPFHDPNIRISNNVLQISASFKLTDFVSISTGIATNKFEYEFSSSRQETINNMIIKNSYEFGSDLFSNYQFLFSINLRSKKTFSSYGYYKTQYTELSMEPGELQVNDSVFMPNYSTLYIPGTLGIGLQFKVRNRFYITAEFSGDAFFGLQNDNGIKNSKALLGFKYTLLENLQLGLIIGRFFKYYNGINIRADGTRRYPHYYLGAAGELTSEYRNSLLVMFNSSYRLTKEIELFLGYQYFRMIFSDYSDLTNVMYLGCYYGIF